MAWRPTPMFGVLFLSMMVPWQAASAGEPMTQRALPPMFAAIQYGETDEVKRLAERHEGLNDRSPQDQGTPIIRAAQIDRWPMVEILLDQGADIWAHDAFGITAAQRTTESRIRPGTPEDAARLRVIAKLKARGYPYPPPDPDQVLALDHAGKWPPTRE